MASPAQGFAKLTPLNEMACRLVSDAVGHMKLNKDETHLKFFLHDTSIPANPPDNTDESEFDSEPQSQERSPIQRGFYQLSLKAEKLPEVPQLGWVVGRGRPGISVDFLLTKPRDPRGKYLAPVHLLFKLHQRSGVLLIKATDQKRPVSYNEDGVWYELAYGTQRVICQRNMLIRLGNCDFEFAFTIAEGDEGRYFDEISTYLDELYGPISPQRPICFLPGNTQSWVFRRHLAMVSSTTLAWGAFGWVREAVALDTGEGLAVKCVQVKSRRQRHSIIDEFRIARQVKDTEGLLGALSLWCEHDLPLDQCNEQGEVVYMSLPLAYRSFESFDWKQAPVHIQLQLFRETLKGLHALHNLGYMHRDITTNNLLIISIDPAKAAITDFGKAIDNSKSSKERTIGPIYTLAPEVFFSPSGYTETIDTWAWAWAIAEVLLGRIVPFEQIGKAKLHAVHNSLRGRGNSSAAIGKLTDLLKRMLAWDCSKRPSIYQALQDLCWVGMDPPNTSEQDISSSKKKPKYDQGTEGALSQATIKTSLFSEESLTGSGEPAGATNALMYDHAVVQNLIARTYGPAREPHKPMKR